MYGASTLMRIVLGPSWSTCVSAWSLDVGVNGAAELTGKDRRVDEEAAVDDSVVMRSLVSGPERTGSAGDEGAVYAEG